MKRGGRTHSPYYRIIVTDSRAPRDGRVIDEIGLYHPCARPEPVETVDVRKALKWLYEGAQPSDTARDILKRLGVMEKFHNGVKPEDVPEEPKAEPVEAAEEAAEPVAAAASEEADAS
jgi:small subunit ribosomal protein S16